MEISDLILEYLAETYRPEEYPALLHQTQLWRETRPLQGVKILDATPLYENTLLKYVPLLEAGAVLTAAIHDRIPYDPALPELLRQWGIPCVHNALSGNYDCILDCNGAHHQLSAEYGYAELTRSGIYHYQQARKPVIFVDDSRIKAIETCLGTGDGFLRGMKQCGFTDFRGRSVVVFGYGKVGRGIVYYAKLEGAEITIVDEPGTPVPENTVLISRYDSPAIQQAVRNAWCVVTATGIFDAMKGNGAAEILKAPESSQIVAAMGVEDEWNNSLPPERILNHGTALNFLLKEPTRLRYIDPTMALSNAAAPELLSGHFPAGIRKISPETEAFYWRIMEQESLIAGELKGIGI